MQDKNCEIIRIGDIVEICGSPIKQDNGVYVIVQDGTSKLYNNTQGLTMLKVAKARNGGYALSTAKYSLCFFPLACFSSRYKYTREEMSAATIEVIKKASPDAFVIVKADKNAVEYKPNEKDVYHAEVSKNGQKIQDVNYLVTQSNKLTAFFSNIVLREGQTLTIVKQMYSDDYNFFGRRGLCYVLEKNTSCQNQK